MSSPLFEAFEAVMKVKDVEAWKSRVEAGEGTFGAYKDNEGHPLRRSQRHFKSE